MDVFEDLDIKLRRIRRARHLRLSIGADGRILLTRPFWVTEKVARAFLVEKRSWLETQWQELQSRPTKLFRRGGRTEYLEHKEAARSLAIKKLAHFNQYYNYSIKRLSIRDQRSRWGSCSRAGGLNFNYRLVFLPEELLDYLIVHELCHLGELNHSPSFWGLVAKTIPDYNVHRKALHNL